jgi:hypothetical protein
VEYDDGDDAGGDNDDVSRVAETVKIESLPMCHLLDSLWD